MEGLSKAQLSAKMVRIINAANRAEIGTQPWSNLVARRAQKVV